MRPLNAIKARIVVIVACLALIISTFATADDQQDLAKESQNPIGNIISLPFENNYFINYNFKSGWYFSSTPTITADWEADSDDR
jgi:putative salt-induced outer membrane protein YdiY